MPSTDKARLQEQGAQCWAKCLTVLLNGAERAAKACALTDVNTNGRLKQPREYKELRFPPPEARPDEPLAVAEHRQHPITSTR
eukprot:scaffold705_cov402-Prasinococcus_capsulatus_cf.AAC.27